MQSGSISCCMLPKSGTRGKSRANMGRSSPTSVFTCGSTGLCDRFFSGASSRSPKTSSFAGRRWRSKDKGAATPLGNQTCSLPLSQRWKTSSSSRAIPVNLLPPEFPYRSVVEHLARARRRGTSWTARVCARGGGACSQAWLIIGGHGCLQYVGQSRSC